MPVEGGGQQRMPRRRHPTTMEGVTIRSGSFPCLTAIELPTYPFLRLRDELAPAAWNSLERSCEEARTLVGDRTLWSINSTARGGGVAEMQRTLWPYWRGAGLDARWLVLNGTPPFFRLTKRLHNLLHGCVGATPSLRDRDLFARVGRAGGAEAAALVRAGDVVILQDPQTAGIVAPLKRAGASVVWRCHVGADLLTDPVEAAWSFLLPYLEPADAFIFTRRAYVRAAGARSRARRSSHTGDRSLLGEEPRALARRRPRGARASGRCGAARLAGGRPRALGSVEGSRRHRPGVRLARARSGGVARGRRTRRRRRDRRSRGP